MTQLPNAKAIPLAPARAPVTLVRQGKPLTLESDRPAETTRDADYCAESFDRWKEREEAKDACAVEAYRRRVLERADPESQAVKMILDTPTRSISER